MVFLTAQGGILGPFCWLLVKILNFIYQVLSASGIEIWLYVLSYLLL